MSDNVAAAIHIAAMGDFLSQAFCVNQGYSVAMDPEDGLPVFDLHDSLRGDIMVKVFTKDTRKQLDFTRVK